MPAGDAGGGNKGGPAREEPLRVYVIGRVLQATGTDTGEAARKFLAWLAEDANTSLTEFIQTWLWLPADAGGPGVLAESAREIAALRAEIDATLPSAPANGEAGR